ncbi:uncharacterized acetyltransferase At3g50280 [Manihot esculenta]|uniref:Acetyltransferase n=1 Tax=Manihot esculenta TaxID=3983 RepID=A0A2C9USH7_MANES|nr:uncharacterized acetyltransferase At3g50280 [Manihot esculenta]OAY33751.1 hypothetical protein MANES_13G121400v8 [Manihot esculenta]
MGQIEYVSATTVKPTTNTNSPQKIESTPFDLPFLVVDYTHRGILFLKPEQQKQHLGKNNVIDHLKISLSRTLDIFAPFAGRLATVENEDGTTSFFIHCNGAGAMFVHAVADGVSVADILEPSCVPTSIVHSFFLMNGVYNFEGISKPLLAVQVTELGDGAVFLGCSYNHAVADGTSFWNFVNTWSEISRSYGEILQPPPVLGYDWFLHGIDHPIRVPFSYDETICNRFISPPLIEKVFHFSKEKIAALKAKANAEMSTSKISSLQAILGLLWRSTIRTRNLDADQEIYCRVLVNMRQRLQPPLPEEYFGNAVVFGTATTTAGELLKNGLGFAALQINKMVAQQTDEVVRKNLENWVKRPVLKKLSSAASNALIVASSPRFNVFGNDFGWGRPVAVRGGAGNNYDGKMSVFPGVREGSVDIQACLLPETLQSMEKDEEFMEALSA